MMEKKIRVKNKYTQQAGMLIIVGIVLIVAYYAVNHMPVVSAGFAKVNGILMPFYLGIIMAYLLCPLYNVVVRGTYKLVRGKFKTPRRGFRLARICATIVSLVCLIIIVAGLLVMVIPDLWDSILGLIVGAPDMISSAQDWIQSHVDKNPQIAAILQDNLAKMSDSAIAWAEEKLLPGAQAIVSGVAGTVTTLLNIVVALIICVYILNSKEVFGAQYRKFVLANFKQEKADAIFEFGSLCNQTFGGFISGKIIDSAIIGLLCFIAMTVLQLPMTMLISVVVGVTNVIPFFGPFIGAIPSIILLLIVDPIAAIKFGIMVLILQQLDGNIIGPKILGKTTKLASFWVMFAIIVGGGLFGFLGMILGVPVFAMIYTYMSRGVNGRLKKKSLSISTMKYQDFSKYDIDKEEVFGGKRADKAKGNDGKGSGAGEPAGGAETETGDGQGEAGEQDGMDEMAGEDKSDKTE